MALSAFVVRCQMSLCSVRWPVPFVVGSGSLWCVVVVCCSCMFGVARSLLSVVCYVLLMCIASCVVVLL